MIVIVLVEIILVLTWFFNIYKSSWILVMLSYGMFATIVSICITLIEGKEVLKVWSMLMRLETWDIENHIKIRQYLLFKNKILHSKDLQSFSFEKHASYKKPPKSPLHNTRSFPTKKLSKIWNPNPKYIHFCFGAKTTFNLCDFGSLALKLPLEIQF